MVQGYNKITVGYVIQTFSTIDGKRVCVSQEFVAGDQVGYEDSKGNPVVVDISREQYMSFDMVQPNTITMSKSGLLFTCPNPECGGHRLECCEDGPYNSEILSIDEEVDFDFGEIDASGQTEKFQCLDCGFVLENKEPGFQAYPITEHTEVVDWIIKNCLQPEGYINPRCADDKETK